MSDARKSARPAADSRPPAAPFSQLDDDELREVLRQVVDCLPERGVEAEWSRQALFRQLSDDERIVAHLYYVEECTMVEIARRMRRTESVVHLLHSRLIDKLRDQRKRRAFDL